MRIAEFAIEKRTLTMVLAASLVLGGIVSFFGLGQLEDPEFTIYTAIVMTPYPGASPLEVEQEVSDRLETAIQTMGDVEHVHSISRAGLSLITVDLFMTMSQEDIPQAWDELRRKVGDAQASLPPGAGPSLVNDDWGDLYGVFYAITGDGYSLTEIEEYAKDLRRELLLIDEVGSIELWGTPTEAVYVEMARSKMAELGLTPADIFGTLEQQGAVVPSSRLHVDQQWVRIAPTGSFSSIEEIGDLLIRGRHTRSVVRLSDVATIHREILDPPDDLLYFDGKPAVGIGLSTVPGGNVVTMGRAVQERLAQLEGLRPVGMELGVVSMQSETVTRAVRSFLMNLVEAVVIVIALLTLFMGLRSGLLIGSVLLLDILGTFIFMSLYEISLQRISLGALIIALGMLVDNAIVVTEGMLTRMQKGMDRVQAAGESVHETMWPLLGATLVAILAFGAISLSDDVTGEYLASLFQVVAVSLLLSWVLAVTVTPVLGYLFLYAKDGKVHHDPYDRPLFRVYRRFLDAAMRSRVLTLTSMAVLLAAAFVGFGFVKQSFFPESNRPQFKIDYWMPEGTHIRDTAHDVTLASNWLLEQECVKSVSSFVGQGALRFILTYEPELPNSSYAQLLVTVDDAQCIDELGDRSLAWFRENLPGGDPQVQRFTVGAPVSAKVEARFSGEDPRVLRRLSRQTREIMRADPVARDIRDDWRERVPVIRPVFAQAQARQAGVTRPDLAHSLLQATSGATVGLYRDGDRLLPIYFRLEEEDRSSVDELGNALAWSSVTGRTVPVGQVVSSMETMFEDSIIRRRDRQRTITVKCEPREGVASALFERLRPKIEALERPPGYTLEWGGEYESSKDANEKLLSNVPLFFVLMVLVVVALFNKIRKTIIVFLTLPLALIGVTAGLLLTGQPFGFMALLGFLSLSGMLIKNSVVLLEQIDINLAEGAAPVEAVLDAGVSRLRPVTMAAFTTVLGMTPLLLDRFWSAMAVTIMSGLTFATLLTLVVVPVLYVTFYRVRHGDPPPRGGPAGRAAAAALVAAALLVAPGASPAQASEPRDVRIGVVTDGTGTRGFDFLTSLVEEIDLVCGETYDVTFPEDAFMDGQWSEAGVADAVGTLLERRDLDLVLAAGQESARALCARDDLATRAVVAFAFEECLPACAEDAAVRVHSLSLTRLIARDLRAFQELVPFEHLVILSDPIWMGSCRAENLSQAIAPGNVRIDFVPVTPGASDVADRLPEGADAVYLMPLRRINAAEFSSMVDDLTRAGLPTFSVAGESEVERGVLAGLNTDAALRAFVRGAALDVLDLLEGRESAERTLVDFGSRFAINMVTAKALGLDLPRNLLSDARLVSEEEARGGEPLTLEQAIRRAVDANLDILIQERVVAAGEQDTRTARSRYRPRVELEIAGTVVDQDHAIPAFGQYERYAAGSLAVSQLIYSPGASAAVDVEEHLQRARHEDRRAVSLDIARATAAAYLSLLRADAMVRVRRDDVDLSRRNHDLARLRHSLGASGIAETYRWESALATARAALVEARATRTRAERQLSRLLDRPLTTRWTPERVSLDDGLDVIGPDPAARQLATQAGLGQLRYQLVQRGLEASPELAAVDAAIDAQRRAYEAARREAYLPTAQATARASHIFAKDEGGGIDLGPFAELVPEISDTSWSVGVALRLPLTTGGATRAKRLEAFEELKALELERQKIENLVAQRVLVALDDASASWPAIALRRQSAEAASKTLELVQDAYARGAASILDLLDAQNAAIEARLAAETAVYGFLDDWAEVGRAAAQLPGSGM